ncbi:MAG: hypothetical protein ACYTFT_16980, partial [Planctomycetota bacterium]
MLKEVEFELTPLPQRYNAMVNAAPWRCGGARIVHFFSSSSAPPTLLDYLVRVAATTGKLD